MRLSELINCFILTRPLEASQGLLVWMAVKPKRRVHRDRALLDIVLCFRLVLRLPLHVFRHVQTSALQPHDVIRHVTGARAVGLASCRIGCSAFISGSCKAVPHAAPGYVLLDLPGSDQLFEDGTSQVVPVALAVLGFQAKFRDEIDMPYPAGSSFSQDSYNGLND